MARGLPISELRPDVLAEVRVLITLTTDGQLKVAASDHATARLDGSADRELWLLSSPRLLGRLERTGLI